MWKTLLSCLLVFSLGNLHAHEGELLSIRNVKIDAHCSVVHFEFELENVNEILLRDVKLDLMSGNTVLASKHYNEAPLERFSEESFDLSVNIFQNVDPKTIRIVVSEIFGLQKDWGGWHGIDPSVMNYNDVGDFEIYADAPWRMSIYDDNNEKRSIPIHMLLHDGNQIWSSTLKPNLEFVDVYIKKSTETTFEALNFNQLSAEEFDALFTSRSPDADSVGIQSFDASMVEQDPNHTLAFKESYNANKDFYYTNLNNPYWYFTLMLPPTYLDDFSDNDFLDIHVKFTLRNNVGDPFYRNSFLRVFRNKEDIPTLPGYYRGDTHVHTAFSLSIIEFGNPIAATKEAAEAIGIDWVIVTDHSASFDEWRGRGLDKTWRRLQTEINDLNAEDPSVPFISGLEVSLKNRQGELVHFLAYPGYDTPTNMPFLGDGGGDIEQTNTTAVKTLERLDSIGGFAYAAHPFANKDEVPTGGNWNVGDAGFPHDGLQFDVGGQVLCNAVNEPSDVFSNDNDKVVQDRLKGGQIWGDRYSMINETDPYDPYNIKAEVNAPLFEAAPVNNSYYLNRYRQGEQVINFVNKKGLIAKNQNPEIKNFKFYFSAGTDAHGSFNYSNTSGFSTIFDEDNVEVKNLAFGNISCVAYCPNGMGDEGQGALKAMYDGNFSLSDGPILVNGISLNGEDVVNELMMGMDTAVTVSDIEDMFVNFQFATTAEFGEAQYIKVFVGTEEGESSFLINDIEAYNATITMPLSDVLEQAGLAVDTNKYIYIRSELLTLAEYGANSPRILEQENFYSFTNPVWIKLNQDVTINVTEQQLKEFLIYPNPVSSVLYISTDLKIKQANVYDASGKLVLQKRLRNNALDVSELSAGNYSLEVLIDDVRVAKQFIVK
ncbi:MAG: T9SS type A sorting domain-containing protein [Bacteroidetes bacterium]|nr:T9SS type A sorting domain-containing protein [Bacteroidota bacterium]